MSKKTIYINVRKNTKYGLIQSLDISVDGVNILTAHTHDVIMLGKEFIDVKSMLIAGAMYTDLINVDKIVTGTPRELYNALCLLHEYGVIPDSYDPQIVSYPKERVSLTRMIKVHKEQTQPTQNKQQNIPSQSNLPTDTKTSNTDKKNK